MNYYLVNVHWTSTTEKEIISSFIVESFSVKDAITLVLSKHSFHLLDERLHIYVTELKLAFKGNSVLSVGDTVQNG